MLENKSQIFLSLDQECSAISLLEEFGISQATIIEILSLVVSYKDHYANTVAKAKFLSKQEKYLDEYGYINIKNPHDARGVLKFGTCGDLARDLLSRMISLRITDALNELGLSITLAAGYEPTFFNQKDNNHVFLIISNKRVKNFSKNNSIVLDPSLQRVGLASVLGYQMKERAPKLSSLEEIYTKMMSKKEGWLDMSRIGNKVFLGITQDMEYTVSFHYERESERVYPVVSLVDKNGVCSQYENDRRAAVVKRAAPKTKNLSHKNLNVVSQILNNLSKPIITTKISHH
ncbi:hypothetical protein KJ654_02090 [Patescibacteria group bacterium]|nr:hypothetical protein [Patescibacteria group bacterium]MBU1966798.1 hypothetical protein [Patescibacteria group bacterium]